MRIDLGRNNDIIIACKFNPSLVNEIKKLPGRQWDDASKTWHVPAKPLYAFAAVRLGEEFNFEIDPKVLTISAEATEEERKEAVKGLNKPPRYVSIETDAIQIYSPYDEQLTAALNSLNVKQGPDKKTIATWNGAKRCWVLPSTIEALTKVIPILERFKFYGRDEVARLATKVSAFTQEAIAASKAHDAAFDVRPGLNGELRPFQRAGVKYVTLNKRAIIADEMGLGKTVEALATVHHLEAYPALIMCPSNLKYNWTKEARHWVPEKSIQVLGPGGFGRADANLCIINYEQLKNYRDFLVRRDFRALVCDESHMLKDGKSQRTVYAEEIALGCLYDKYNEENIKDKSQKLHRARKQQVRDPIPIRLLLTGTPIPNDPMELTPQLAIISRLQDFGGWYQYQKRYGEGKNGTELHDRLRALCYLRRLKSEVLKELPPKIRTVVPLSITNRAEYIRAEDDLIEYLQSTKGDKAADSAARAIQIVRIEKLKQLAARGKMKAIKDWTEDFLATGQKLVLFAWHQEIVKEIAETFKCPALYGGVPQHVRNSVVDEFQRPGGKINLLSVNIRTGGVGLTLTAASNVGFIEFGWNPATMDQAGDRCHRIGQTDSVTEWWFTGNNTIDIDIQQIIERKRLVVDAVQDGIEPEDNISTFAELVDRLRAPDRKRSEEMELF